MRFTGTLTTEFPEPVDRRTVPALLNMAVASKAMLALFWKSKVAPTELVKEAPFDMVIVVESVVFALAVKARPFSVIPPKKMVIGPFAVVLPEPLSIPPLTWSYP